ncbi:hypothetical protein GsuE55_01060 [Geobacillus subterraneus]|uniref:Uncharacterized protein n=1 Tax=Geobacillus subterraneus TaxID=129338 RepID=A0A679FHZ6_9BACL|nr:hypothetical protein GsuE55_01060 [Geobacillus subterraneus]
MSSMKMPFILMSPFSSIIRNVSIECGGIFMLFHEYVLKNEPKADKVINVSDLNIYLYLSIFM